MKHTLHILARILLFLLLLPIAGGPIMRSIAARNHRGG